MANFNEEMRKALNFVTKKQVARASRAVLTKYRKNFIIGLFDFAKNNFKFQRGAQKFADKFQFNKAPEETPNGATDSILVRNPQFSFLAFPNKQRQVRRKNGTFGKRRVVEAVDVGKGFRSYQGVTVANFQGNLVPVRTKKEGFFKKKAKAESMQVNLVNMIVNKPSNFEAATKEYSLLLMTDLGKRIIRAAARRLNKKVKFKVGSR